MKGSMPGFQNSWIRYLSLHYCAVAVDPVWGTTTFIIIQAIRVTYQTMPRRYYLSGPSRDYEERPRELPDGRLVCRHGWAVCGKGRTDYSFMEDDEYEDSDYEDYYD
ncbi:hypothetical protein DL765_002768 [Monosporascus sp. GIB2]|nr:hypothetical protein DL765_002768 [Monosporascus sp. GIB2]